MGSGFANSQPACSKNAVLTMLRDTGKRERLNVVFVTAASRHALWWKLSGEHEGLTSVN